MNEICKKLRDMLWGNLQLTSAKSAMLDTVQSLVDDRNTLQILRTLVQDFPFEDDDGRARIIADATELLGYDPHRTLPI